MTSMTERYIRELTSPIGTVAMVISDGALEVLDFKGANGRFAGLVKRHCPPGVRRAASDPSGIADRIAAYFEGELEAIRDIETRLDGTAFQKSVWQALCTIPCGSTITYGELARRVGNPRASQAVGRTNGLNPVSIVLPCHRVIGANGSLTGYGGGLERKAWLLRHEGISHRFPDA